jgi:adenylate cyclase
MPNVSRLLRSRAPLLAGSLLLVLMCLLHLRLLPFSGIIPRLAYGNLALFFKLRGPIAPHEQIVLVTIDDTSLQRVGAWPWPRLKLAELLQALIAAGPRLVVCDFVLPPRLEDPGGELELARVMRSASGEGGVVLPYYFSDLSLASACRASDCFCRNGLLFLPEFAFRELAGRTYQSLQGKRH